MGRSVLLETLVGAGAGTGRFERINLSVFDTDAGASANAQAVLGLAEYMSQALRGQYMIGYYTTRKGSFEERGLKVKAATEGLTVSIEPPKEPEKVAAAPAAAAQPVAETKPAEKGKVDDKNKKDDKNNKEKKK
jgi:hypothetical protein